MIRIDFSEVPEGVALVLSQQQHTERLADELAVAMSLDAAERSLLHQELVGTIAEFLSQWVDDATNPDRDHGSSDTA